MNKKRIDRLEEKIIKDIVKDYYCYYAADTLDPSIDQLESLMEEINGPSVRRQKAIDRYDLLSIEELRKFDPDSPRVRKYQEEREKSISREILKR